MIFEDSLKLVAEGLYISPRCSCLHLIWTTCNNHGLRSYVEFQFQIPFAHYLCHCLKAYWLVVTNQILCFYIFCVFTWFPEHNDVVSEVNWSLVSFLRGYIYEWVLIMNMCVCLFVLADWYLIYLSLGDLDVILKMGITSSCTGWYPPIFLCQCPQMSAMGPYWW